MATLGGTVAGFRPAGSIFVDTFAHGSSSSTTATAILTTLFPNEVIMAYIIYNGGPLAGSKISGGGLTWASRATAVGGGSPDGIDEWYAIASSPLSAVTITVTQTTATFMLLTLVAIANANTTSPFDGSVVFNGSLPFDPLSITTTNAKTLIIAGFRENTTNFPTAGSGFIQLYGSQFSLTEYATFTSPQTGLSVGQTVGSGNSNGGIADAIVSL
jgi:hypothetical protein